MSLSGHSSSSGELEKRVPEVPHGATHRHELTPPTYHVATQGGVQKVEAVTRVWTPALRVALFVGVAITACKFGNVSGKPCAGLTFIYCTSPRSILT